MMVIRFEIRIQSAFHTPMYFCSFPQNTGHLTLAMNTRIAVDRYMSVDYRSTKKVNFSRTHAQQQRHYTSSQRSVF